MVPASAYLLDLYPICEHFNWLLSMHVERVRNTKLSILVKSNSEDPSVFGQEKRVEFATRHLFDPLSTEIGVLIRLLRITGG